MKCRDQLIALSCRYDLSVNRREHFHILIRLFNIRRTDKCHWNRPDPFKFFLCKETAELSSVRIAQRTDIHGSECRSAALHFSREKDQAGTGSVYRKPRLYLCKKWLIKPVFPHQLRHNGALSARKDQRVKRTLQILLLADLKDFRTEFF